MKPKGASRLAPNETRRGRRWPGADVAHRGADMCRQAIGLPPRHTLPVEEPEDDHERPER